MSAPRPRLTLPALPDWTAQDSDAWAVEVARRVLKTWPSVEAARGSGQALALRVALWRAGVPFVHREKTVELVRFARAPEFPRACRIVSGRVLDAVVPMSDETRRVCEARGCWSSLAHEVRPPPGDVAVIVMSGLPGAGKDTWLTRHHPDLPVVSLDGLRAELSIAHGEEPARLRTEAFARANSFLSRREPFAWSSTLLRLRERKALIDWLVRHGAHVELVSLEVSVRVQKAQNRSRAAVVPDAALERMLARWEPVLPDEAHHEQFFEDGEARVFEP
ncbi:MAG: AAA family ATPase [Myxococcales bacterium]|nr:AAA family ATPase [Myxococcales bacterium]